MPTTITATSSNPERQGSFFVTAAFADPDGSAVTPDSGLKWKLTDDSGLNVINSRNDVSISPDTSVTVELDGDDLELFGEGDDGIRRLTVYGTYQYNGSTRNIRDYLEFTINDTP